MFNTLRYAKMLEEVGFSREQAETSVKILVEIMEDKLASKLDLQDLKTMTKQDLMALDNKMDSRFSQLEAKLEAKISLMESKLTVKMGTMLAASIAILTAIQKLI